MSRTLKGFFRPSHPEKYHGNPLQIVYRSSWELLVMRRLDTDPNVIEWSSEPFGIPYADPSTPVRQGGMKMPKLRRYFVDFQVKRKSATTGKVEVLLVEIKPLKECGPPAKGKKTARRYAAETLLWARNRAKWEAAKRHCDSRGWKFMVMTEQDLGLAR